MSELRGRLLARHEIPRLFEIDRRERIDAMYAVEAGRLQLRAESHDVRGWPEGEPEEYIPLLEDCHDRGGWCFGLFDEDTLVAAAVLESRRIGRRRDRLQLKFLHVGRDQRHRGLGQRLFAQACEEARARGAGGVYVSATPSRRTVDFYLRLGCRLCEEPDPELFALEPEDIHLERPLA